MKIKELFLSYELFKVKQPNSVEVLLTNNPKLVTFLNPYSISYVKDNITLYSKFDFICSDGMLPVLINNFWGKDKIERISFDFTSLAKDIFKFGSEKKLNFYFLGGDKNSIDLSVNKIKTLYPELKVMGWHHGFFNDSNKITIINDIISNNIDVVIIGMGTPYQDIFSIELREYGFTGSIFTCGGFFTQIAESRSSSYYPFFIDELNLRWLYRMIREPHTRKRYLLYYPVFVFTYSLFVFWDRFIKR